MQLVLLRLMRIRDNLNQGGSLCSLELKDLDQLIEDIAEGIKSAQEKENE